MTLLTALSGTIQASNLKSVLTTSTSNRRPVAVIIEGPSGSGKTTLAKTSAVAAGLQIRRLTPKSLSADDAAEIELAIAAAFQQPIENASLAVILEDLDIWAPASPRTPADYRIIAALGDELSALHETPCAVVFLATAVSTDAIYHGLLREDRIGVSVRLTALTVGERTQLCSDWLERMFGISDEVGPIAQKMAAATPGFVHADMRRLFNDLTLEIDRRRTVDGYADGYADGYVGDLVQLFETPWVWDSLKAVKPSLLTASGGSYIAKESSKFKPKMCGLDDEIQQCKECLQSVFAVVSDFSDDDVRETVHTLRRLGTFKGLILHGPTGCGKSAIANLVPSMLPSNTVNFLRIDSTSIVSSVIGEAERKLGNLFAVAHAIAPAMVTIENIDILAANRDLTGLDGGSAEETFNRLLSTLLTAIDGVSSRDMFSSSVFVIGTTRSLDLIDPALLRPGRLELHIGVRAPDADARVELLRSFLETRGVQLEEGIGGTLPAMLERFKTDSEGWTAPDVFAFGRELIFDKIADKINVEP